ncbi:MAG: hypothetical protein Q8R40_00225 [bacterium]|nr:hypothetical protein [bacterium]
MRHWTHEELHALMDSDQALKIKSDNVHALPRVSSEQKERGKLQMMELYAEAIHCKQINIAKEYVKKVFECLRQEKTWGIFHNEYVSQKMCHSPLGNDYICFCNETC